LLWDAIADSLNKYNSFIRFCLCCIWSCLAVKNEKRIEKQYRKNFFANEVKFGYRDTVFTIAVAICITGSVSYKIARPC
jgi:hypothetical protein